jgi:hypothetical protein
MRYPLVMGLLATVVGPADATVFFEITAQGQAPRGADNFGFPFYYTGRLDVYAWGSGTDTGLHSADFDIVFVPIYGPTINFLNTGTVDPSGLFSGPRSAGSIQGSRIEHVQVASSGVVPLPATPSQALLLYSGFNVFFDGQLRVAPNTVVTNATNAPATSSYSVFTTPEPAVIPLLVLGGLLLVRRRR